MIVTKVSIVGLFERFNHILEFPEDEPITIIIGPNGFGKTMILSAINALFNQSPTSLIKIPFRDLSVEFSDKSRIDISNNRSTTRSDSKLEVFFHQGGTAPKSAMVGMAPDAKNLGIPISLIEDIVPVLDQIGAESWRHSETGERLTLGDVVEQFGDELLPDNESYPFAFPKWLREVTSMVAVRLIDTERLTSSHRPVNRPPWKRHIPGGEMRTMRTVSQYSRDLAGKVRHSISKYGTLAQSLDRTFPVRVVEEPMQSDFTIDELRQELSAVEDTRSKLVEAGLLVEDHTDYWGPLALDNIDKAKQGVLAVYARDARDKLKLFDDLYRRVDALKRIANSRLLYKSVSVGSEGLQVTSDDGAKLDLDMLSSGEQHELVILYELLFRVPDNGFILFDEPELSLHVDWQEQFLDDLHEMAKISKFQALLATHSPQIIGDRWDLTVELKGPNYK